MAYDGDQTWDDLVGDLSVKARNFVHNLLLYHEAYNDWQTFRDGRTDAQIATALSRATADVADLDAAYAAFKDLHDLANNVVVAQGDRLFALRHFT